MSVRIPVRWLLLAALVLLPGIAGAQTTDSPPRLSIGAGAGVAIPFHADFDFTPWAWEADVRLAMSRHVLFEVAAGEWRHSETRVVQNIRVTMPAGVIGRFEQTTTRVQRTLQANVLFSGAAGRVRVSAGGGVGLLQHDRRTRQASSDCSPDVSCGSFESSFSSVSGAVQGVGGAEVRVYKALGVYGQARFVVPMTDPGGSDLRVTTGARWSFGR